MARWEQIDAAPPQEARALLRTCCGAARWVRRMMERRPFGTREAALTAARAEWFALGPDAWREAFGHHPRIGGRGALHRGLASTRALSEREQSGVRGASEDVLSALLESNRQYEARFGYIFIVCAAGKSAEEMLAMLRERLKNDPQTELRVAVEEHAKICEMRLTGD